MVRRMRHLTCTALLWLAACASPVLDAKNYGATCAQASDCVEAFFGDVCKSLCACANGAIAKSAQAQYAKDKEAAAATCGPRPAIACAPCMQPVVQCTNGACALKP